MKKILISLVVLAVMMTEVQPVMACTSVIVSGRVTKDGRPMISSTATRGRCII